MASSSKSVSRLAALVNGRLLVDPGDVDPVVTDVTHDSREVSDGWLYVAIEGERVDGHDFVPDAIEKGAVAVCVARDVAAPVPQILVDDTRLAMGELAAAAHDYPSTALDVVGVTGTNGKTTVTHFVESIARDAGLMTGLVGTIHTRAAGSSIPAKLTTPEASDFQRLLASMRDEGVALVAAEVSSHALEFGRVRGTRFAVAAFTNLSQDHLDFHGDMAAYRAAKKRLFTEYDIGTAVINVDDETGAEIAAGHSGDLLRVGAGGDVVVSALDRLPAGTRVRLGTPWGEETVDTPVIGDFNVQNLALAAACCLAAGIELDEVVAGMASVDGVPGRFEVVSSDDPVIVVVDYAHTPQAVATAVETGRRIGSGRVIALVGAGGDRDTQKRPEMGRALSMADLAIVTSDNPRSEDPEEIAAAVMSGVDRGSAHVLEVDRRTAIDMAIDAADAGDVVLILGRGHEPMQDLGDRKVPFDDREVAAASLKRRRRSADSGNGSGSMST